MAKPLKVRTPEEKKAEAEANADLAMAIKTIEWLRPQVKGPYAAAWACVTAALCLGLEHPTVRADVAKLLRAGADRLKGD